MRKVALGETGGGAQLHRMARRPRLEFEGAIYHVFNRVNPGGDVFGTSAAAGLFEDCMLEARGEFGWRFHAWCIVREGFHIALETPRANLVSGMHWFQSMFAKRLRDDVGTTGPLFQGRYRALPVERGAPLANLANYIHLRPADTGVVAAELLPLFRWSSLRRIIRRDCPGFLSPSEWIGDVREIVDEPDRIAAYASFLVQMARDPERHVAIGMRGMMRGPVIGSRDFRNAIPVLASLPPAEVQWFAELDRFLGVNGKTRDDIAADPKGAPWKVELARELRVDSGAPLDWIARELGMGTVNTVSHHLWIARRAARELRSA
jgi:hypothetical protein